MCPWAYAQRVIFWVLERMLTQRLSVRSKGHFLGPWAYAQWVIFWVLERTLKGSFFGSLSVRSKGHFLGPWAYTQRVIFWFLERMLKGSFFGSLSVCSKGKFCTFVENLHKSYYKKVSQIILQYNLFIFLCLPYFFNELRTQKMTLWVYVQEPIKWPFERTLKDPKNDLLSKHSIAVWA